MENLGNIHKTADKRPLEFATRPRRIISWLPIVLIAVGVVILAVAVYNKYFPQTYTSSSVGSQSPVSVLSEASESARVVVVDIGGAVVKPGLYELPDDSRIADVLITAGGLDPNANRNYVSKSINLAQKISDGQKIYIPFTGENISPIESDNSGTLNQNDPISINQGSTSQLDTLSGVGPVTAGKIISGRPYQKLEELVSRKIISRTLFTKIKDRLVL